VSVVKNYFSFCFISPFINRFIKPFMPMIYCNINGTPGGTKPGLLI